MRRSIVRAVAVLGDGHRPLDGAVTATPQMCAVCFHAVATALKAAHGIAPALVHDRWMTPLTAPPPMSAPLFVTWREAKSDKLRGCIGTFETKPLSQQLPVFAKHAALGDSRFAPVVARELPALDCKISTLHTFERAANWADWQVGRHGIRICSANDKHTATFLPTVASDHGWDKRQTLRHLVDKAGLPKPHGTAGEEALFESLVAERYQHSEASLDFEGYLLLMHATE